METKGIKFLKQHESANPSQFEDDTQWRKENGTWLKWSRKVSLTLIDYMQRERLSRSDLAHKLGVSPQYISKILSGKVNFSFKTIAEIEDKLGVVCMALEDA
jgi:ribosome-binding protein aMBF1 (putative translation factor)